MPVLESAEQRKLLNSIPATATTLRDLRRRALIATMKVEDFRPRGAGWTVRVLLK
jgi:hypothetical protein